MVVADCESELFRDNSRGLHGGAFFVATLLNRKEAKTARGKDNIDSLKDLINLKVDARFCHYYIKRNNLDPDVDNTPDDVKVLIGEFVSNFTFGLNIIPAVPPRILIIRVYFLKTGLN